MRLYSFDLARFREQIEDDPYAETIPLNKDKNPWLLFAYRREVMQDVDGEPHGTGSFEYGHVYRNKKGRYSLVGLAEEDYNATDY
jgi:hypothetical protein